MVKKLLKQSYYALKKVLFLGVCSSDLWYCFKNKDVQPLLDADIDY